MVTDEHDERAPEPRPLHREASRALVSALVAGPLVAAYAVAVSLLGRHGRSGEVGFVGVLFLVGTGVFAATLVLAGALARRAARAWRLPLLGLLGLAVAGLAAAAIAWVRALGDGGPEAAWQALWEGARWAARRPGRSAFIACLAMIPFVLVGGSRCDVLAPARTPGRDLARQVLAGAASGLLVFALLAATRSGVGLRAFLGYMGSATLAALGLALADRLEPRLAAGLRRALGGGEA